MSQKNTRRNFSKNFLIPTPTPQPVTGGDPSFGVTGPKDLLNVAPRESIPALRPLVDHTSRTAMPTIAVSISSLRLRFGGVEDAETQMRFRESTLLGPRTSVNWHLLALVLLGLSLTCLSCKGGGSNGPTGGPGAGLANSAWPKFQRSATNNGWSPSTSVSGVETAEFGFPVGGECFDPAIGSDGTIYVGHREGPSGSLYAFTYTGHSLTKKWSFPIGISGPLDFPEVFISTPAIGADGSIYFAAAAGGKGRIYALTDGGTAPTQKWSFDPQSPATGSPNVGPDNTVYAPAGKLYALSGLTGQSQQQFVPDSGVVSSPGLDSKGHLYVGADKVYALDSHTLSKQWSFAIANAPPAPVPANATAFFGAPSIDESFGYLYIWANITAPPAQGQLFGSSFGRVYGLAMADGSYAWSGRTEFDTSGSTVSTPVFDSSIPGGELVFATIEKPVLQQVAYAWPPFSVFWQWETQPMPFSSDRRSTTTMPSPAVAADGTVYVNTASGLLAFDGGTGSKKWVFSKSSSGGPAIGSDGTVYVGSSFFFYAIH